MKKILLLSVVASTMIMAGGDIAPVEPVVEAPVEVSAWEFGGQLVAYTQTTDVNGNGDLFGGDSTYAAWGGQLRATNSDIFAGIGAGVEVSAIVSSEDAGFYNAIDANTGLILNTGGGNAGTTSGGFTQAYLTYGFDNINTSIKLGRQTLPKSLSPFAFSEGWQVFKNTFDAALVVNSSLPNTTLVYAFVKNGNSSVGNYLDEDSFGKLNGSDGIHMFTAMNKSIDNLTLTGTYYYGADATVAVPNGGDLDILWGDATYKADALTVGVQGGQVSGDGLDSTSAFGAKLGYNFGMFGAAVAYTSVDDGDFAITNTTGVKSPLYTQMVLNNVGQYHALPGSDFLKITGTAKALGGKFTLAYGAGENDDIIARGDYTQVDFMYKTKLTENTTLFAAYVYTDDDADLIPTAPSESNFVRFWARYNF